MANQPTQYDETDFHRMRTYKAMPAAERRMLAAYRREFGVTEQQVADQFALVELDEDEATIGRSARWQGPTQVALAVVMVACAVHIGAPWLIAVCAVLVAVMLWLWLSGRLNRYEFERRRIRKRLEAMSAPMFADWRATQPDSAAADKNRR